jgi:hypothetical protein
VPLLYVKFELVIRALVEDAYKSPPEVNDVSPVPPLVVAKVADNPAAVVAVVALVAVEAFPLKAAVIVPALKLPEASRATIVDAVLALVALDVTVNVAAVD